MGMDPNSNTPPSPNTPPTTPAPIPGTEITEIENPPVVQPSNRPIRKTISKKLVTILLVVVAIFIAFYAGIYIFLNDQLNKVTHTGQALPTSPAEPTPVDPTANWQVYTNNDLGFSLKFPEGWKVTDESPQIRFTPENAPIPSGLGTRLYGYEFIVSVDKKNNQTPEQFWSDKVTTGMRTPATENVTIGGAPGIVTSNNSLDAHDTTMYISKNNSLYTIQENYYMSDSDQAKKQFPKAEKEFELILSSFKFLNPNAVSTCTPRPACLDQTPRCLIPETPDMCPKEQN